MAMFPLKLPPGVFRNGTEYQAQGRWYDSNMMRWHQDTMRPVGGWLYAAGTQLMDGPGRGILTWRANSNAPWGAIGTVDSLWSYDGDQIVDITPAGFPAGVTDSVPVAGYGSGLYGSGLYGASSSGVSSQPTTWQLDHFGEDLLACASHDGTIYRWSPTTPSTLPTALTNAPVNCRGVFVTAERFVVALGADGDPRYLQWTDQENATAWADTQTNQAGDQTFQTVGALVRGVKVRGQSLILSTTDAWTMRYQGLPFVYGFERAGDQCGLIATNAVQEVNGGAMWMGQNGFFNFDGSSVRSIRCDVSDYIFSDINLDERAKITSAHNSAWSEITFWWCSSGSTTLDRGCTYNYAEGHWALHQTPYLRSCWADRGAFDWPLAASESGRLYYQERGWTANGTLRGSQVFAQSGPVEIGGGDQVVHVLKCLPDEVTPGAWVVRFSGRFSPEQAEQLFGTYTLVPQTDVRLTARQVSVQIEGVTDGDNRVGVFRFDGRAASGR